MKYEKKKRKEESHCAWVEWGQITGGDVICKFGYRIWEIKTLSLKPYSKSICVVSGKS